mgnify:CR=1 FL=1
MAASKTMWLLIVTGIYMCMYVYLCFCFSMFKWFIDNDAGNPGQLVLFRTVAANAVTQIRDGGSIFILQEQDTLGNGLDLQCNCNHGIINFYRYSIGMDRSPTLLANKNEFMTTPKNIRSSHMMLCGATHPSTVGRYA